MKSAQEYIDKAFEAFGDRAEKFRNLRPVNKRIKSPKKRFEVKIPTPRSRRQIRKFENYLHKALSVTNDQEKIKEIKQYLQLVKDWKKREFVGNGWLLLVSLLIFAYYVYATIHNAESWAGFEAEVREIIAENPWIMVFNVAYVFSFILYFWAFRAPRWLSRTKGLNGNSSFNPLSMFHYGPIQQLSKLTIIKDETGKTVDIKSTVVGQAPSSFIISTFLGLIGMLILFAFLWMLLPLITIYGILRFRVFCV